MNTRKKISEASKSINWLESTSRSLSKKLPQAEDCSDYVTEQLAALMLDRLPQHLCIEMIELLPKASQEGAHSLQSRKKKASADATIGFGAFIERARHSLGMSSILDSPPYDDSEEEFEKLCTEVAEGFLWAVTQEIPTELKSRMIEHLPLELRSRMNLYSGFSNADKVA